MSFGPTIELGLLLVALILVVILLKQVLVRGIMAVVTRLIDRADRE